MKVKTLTKVGESRSPPVPSPSPSPSHSRTPESEDDRKVLYMFFSFLDAPIAYQLYAVKVPNLSSLVKAKNDYDPKKQKAIDISPVLEFASQSYASGMCCVELDSKLYFLGGTMADSDFLNGVLPEFPCDVRVLDTSKISMDVPLRSDSDTLLQEGPPMKSGKPHICLIVAEKKIYAISSFGLSDTPILST